MYIRIYRSLQTYEMKNKELNYKNKNYSTSGRREASGMIMHDIYRKLKRGSKFDKNFIMLYMYNPIPFLSKGYQFPN